jgi:hypothetical protein
VWNDLMWTLTALRFYPEMARLQGGEDEVSRQGLRRAGEKPPPPVAEWHVVRPTMYYLNSLWADAMLLGARLAGEGVEINPLGEPMWWPAQQTVHTPFGDLNITTQVRHDSAVVRFQAQQDFPVTLRWGDLVVETTSQQCCTINLQALHA